AGSTMLLTSGANAGRQWGTPPGSAKTTSRMVMIIIWPIPSTLPKSNVAAVSSTIKASAPRRRTNGVQNSANAKPNSTAPAAVTTVATSKPRVISGCDSAIGATQPGYTNFSIAGHSNEVAVVHRRTSKRKAESLILRDTESTKKTPRPRNTG